MAFLGSKYAGDIAIAVLGAITGVGVGVGIATGAGAGICFGAGAGMGAICAAGGVLLHAAKKTKLETSMAMVRKLFIGYIQEWFN